MERYTSIVTLIVLISGICSINGLGGRFPVRSRPLIPRNKSPSAAAGAQATATNANKHTSGGNATPKRNNQNMFNNNANTFPGMNRSKFMPFCPWVAPGDCPELNIAPYCFSWKMMNYMGQPCRGCAFDSCERFNQNGMEINQDLMQMGIHPMYQMNYMNPFAFPGWGNMNNGGGHVNNQGGMQAGNNNSPNFPGTTMNPWMMALYMS